MEKHMAMAMAAAEVKIKNDERRKPIMKKFVAAIASVLMVGAMLTSAMAAAVPSVTVPSVVVPSVVVKTPTVTDATVKIIESTDSLDDAELAIRVTYLEDAIENDAFVAEVYANVSAAESVDAYVKSQGADVDLTGYKLSTLVKIEASQALKDAMGEDGVVLTVSVPGVEEGMEAAAVVLEQVDGQTVAHPVEAVVTAEGVLVTTNVFGVLLIAVK